MASSDAAQISNHRGAQAVTTSIVFTAVASFFVIVRCITRFGVLRTCGADDVLIMCSLALSIAFTGLMHAQEQHGLGRHQDSLSPEERIENLRPFWYSVIVYYLGLTLIKSSILCQFLRFLVDRFIRRVCWAMLVLVAVYGACTVFGTIFACTPVAYFWDKTTNRGHCINLLAFWFTNATFNIVSDIAICILPMPALKSLRLPKKQKYGLIIVFAMGGFGCITSIVRLHSLYTIAHSTDTTWTNVAAATWSSIELNVGITCACLPTMKPVLDRMFSKLPQNRHHNSSPARPERYIQHSRGRDNNEVVEIRFNDAALSQGWPMQSLDYMNKNQVHTRMEQV